MKKMSKKVISFFISVSIILCMFLTSSISYADEIDPGTYKPSSEYGLDKNFVHQYGGSALGYLKYVSIMIAVIVIMFVGVKYMTGSLSQKAEYKKDLIPIGIGIIIISFITTIITTIATAGVDIGH